MNRAAWREQPDAEAADDDHENRHRPEHAAFPEHDDSAEDQKGNGVGREVGEIAVEKRSGQDSHQTTRRTRPNTIVIEVPERHEEIEAFQNPHHRQQTKQRDGMRPDRAEQVVGRLARRRGRRVHGETIQAGG